MLRLWADQRQLDYLFTSLLRLTTKKHKQSTLPALCERDPYGNMTKSRVMENRLRKIHHHGIYIRAVLSYLILDGVCSSGGIRQAQWVRNVAIVLTSCQNFFSHIMSKQCCWNISSSEYPSLSIKRTCSALNIMQGKYNSINVLPDAPIHGIDICWIYFKK